jgi:hypothetical protein
MAFILKIIRCTLVLVEAGTLGEVEGEEEGEEVGIGSVRDPLTLDDLIKEPSGAVVELVKVEVLEVEVSERVEGEGGCVTTGGLTFDAEAVFGVGTVSEDSIGGRVGEDAAVVVVVVVVVAEGGDATGRRVGVITVVDGEAKFWGGT